MLDKASIGLLIASLSGGTAGVAGVTVWDLNTEVKLNAQAIVSTEKLNIIHFDYIKKELVEIKQLIKDFKKGG